MREGERLTTSAIRYFFEDDEFLQEVEQSATFEDASDWGVRSQTTPCRRYCTAKAFPGAIDRTAFPGCFNREDCPTCDPDQIRFGSRRVHESHASDAPAF